MHSSNDTQSVMDRLLELAALVGIAGPLRDESAGEYGARILTAINPDDEVLDDEVRFRILVLITQGVA